MKSIMRIADLVSFYRALASCLRLRILSLLAKRPLCVNALARSLGISQPAVSQHLEVLEGARLVIGERMGTMVHYRLDREQANLIAASTALLLGQPRDTIDACHQTADAPARRREGQSE